MMRNGTARSAIITGMLVMVVVLRRAVIMTVARVHRLRLRLAMAEWGRQGSGDALQRHHRESCGQDQFFQPK